MLNGLAGWKREAQRSCWVCKLRMEMERGNECMSDREEIGRVGVRYTAMRTVVESENGDEKREGC
mgnify:FL=1